MGWKKKKTYKTKSHPIKGHFILFMYAGINLYMQFCWKINFFFFCWGFPTLLIMNVYKESMFYE